jgi:hypothetical protein
MIPSSGAVALGNVPIPDDHRPRFRIPISVAAPRAGSTPLRTTAVTADKPTDGNE